MSFQNLECKPFSVIHTACQLSNMGFFMQFPTDLNPLELHEETHVGVRNASLLA